LAEAVPAEATSAEAGNLEVLRRIRAAESEGEARLRAAEAEGTRRREQFDRETEAAITSARAAVEALRQRVLSEAQQRADSEAEQILEEGRAAAAGVTSGDPQLSPQKRAAVLELLFGDFLSGEG
jgi:vacuolar-type H+-ATPase subunit H